MNRYHMVLYRCNICLVSMITLVNNGFIGSANALLRQCYEFLCWAKLAIDSSDSKQLVKLHDAFYEDNGRADNLTAFLKAIDYKINDNKITKHQIIQEGKDLFSGYSKTVHATSLAQQFPLKQEDFYLPLKACLRELALWIICLTKVQKDYFIKNVELNEKKNEDNIFLFGILNYYLEIIQKYEYKLLDIFPKLNETEIYRIFCDSIWELK